MSNNIDLKDLWNKRESEIPDIHKLLIKAQKLKKNHLARLILTNILLILTVAFVVFIWYYYKPEMLSTKLGITLTILAIVLYLFVYNQMIPILVKVDFKICSKQYIQQLKKLEVMQSFLQKTMLNTYFILVSIGVCLYLVEYTLRMILIWAVFTYGITILLITINWFYFIPGTIKKQQARITELISKIEELNGQLSEE
jgi:hypothetical protein